MTWEPPPTWEPDDDPAAPVIPEPPLGLLEPWSDDWEMGLMSKNPEYTLYKQFADDDAFWDAKALNGEDLRNKEF